MGSADISPMVIRTREYRGAHWQQPQKSEQIFLVTLIVTVPRAQEHKLPGLQS